MIIDNCVLNMIVDCHTHFDDSVDESLLSQHLSASEVVDSCMVLGASSQSSEKANKTLSDYVGRHKDKLVGFGVVNPVIDNVGVKALKTFRDKLGLDGVVLYCSNHRFHPAHSRAMQFYEAAQQCALPVFIHNCGDLNSDAALEYAQPYLLDEVARNFPDLKIVIGSMGAPFPEQTLAMVARHKNVFANLTIPPERVWQVYNIVISAFEQGVMDKLLFGSGFPRCMADQCIETLLGFNKILGDSNLPTVPRGNIRAVIERDTLKVLGINQTE